ncbi:ClbS/DfsB family four-helix bundle protein [Vagococcus sp. DIV0080]|uniref:ClbS/DfsB family four-helix bundle protein n=1 Tax=Candidatus Vagococcus giribetii TaxID=2230876 RepID=A0ABS3HQP3_9ENTE|nr:ClbS/DfsB family four-helix bundle protein [Vagococcus sp. DIV0080]MBO0476055.1 ClbS/DfsB family four-helix bundle protein [Vagococcus sp. DIV0080]
MVRPTTKEELLTQGQLNYEKLLTLIDSLSPEEQVGTFPFDSRDRQIRDSLCHLYEWHQLFIKWVKANTSGEATPFLPEPYNWKTYPNMNIGFFNAHQTTDLASAKDLLQKSHEETLAIIRDFSDEELFTKKYYNWTGSTSLGSYAVSATSSHYDWALKLIRKYKKSLPKTTT